jgi:hypothetical protein
MHKLATHVIDTHGGLDRWQRHDALTAHLIQGSAHLRRDLDDTRIMSD